jgi:2-C-methyl-D-erythritol 4-phosphate cytidylyltransferase
MKSPVEKASPLGGIKNLLFVLVAAGSGSRFGAETQKQFLYLKKKEIFQYSLDLFLNFDKSHKRFHNRTVLVLPQERLADFKKKYRRYRNELKNGGLLLVSGGIARSISVYNGIHAGLEENNFLVVVHDAARPLLTENQLKSFLDKLFHLPRGALLLSGRWARDTIVESNGQKNKIVKVLNRNQIFLAETPQGFYKEDYQKVLQKIGISSKNSIKLAGLTDESSLYLENKNRVIPFVMPGDNPKITFKEDMLYFKQALKR